MRGEILPSLRSTHCEDSVVLDIERFAIDYQLENGIIAAREWKQSSVAMMLLV